MAYTRRVRMTIIAALALAALATAASAQQRTYYDASGKSLGRSTTDSQGTVTNTDSRGKVISREFTSGNRRRSTMRAAAMSARSTTSRPLVNREAAPLICRERMPR